MKSPQEIVMKELRKMPDFANVKFIMGFGSYFKKTANPLSDYDFAIYYSGNEKERFKFRMKILSLLPDKYDIKIYQDLPLYIQPVVLGGVLIYSKDISFVYNIAYETIRKYEDFKKYYFEYINSRRLKV